MYYKEVAKNLKCVKELMQIGAYWTRIVNESFNNWFLFQGIKAA